MTTTTTTAQPQLRTAHPAWAGITREQLEAAFPGSRRRRLDRIEDYLFIGGGRMPAARAAQRLGVSDRTIQRYRSALRAAGGAW